MKFIRRKKIGRIIFAILIVIGITIGLWIAVRDLFQITHVEVIGAQIDVRIDQEKMNKNLLFFPTQKIRTQLLSQNPLVENIEIQKKFPHTIRIIVTSRMPIARVALSDRTVLVDREGVVIGLSGDADNFPLLSLNNDESLLIESLEIVARMEQGELLSITKIDNATLLAKSTTTDIYFPQSDQIQNKVATLQSILSGFRIKGTLPKVIDLRFEKPIVTF